MSATPAPASTPLVGRTRELAAISAVLGAAREGRGGALVLTGEPGAGKSALLDRALADATGFAVARATGAEFERDFPYAGLAQLCVPLLPHLDRVSPHHREALGVAFGLAEGAPDPFRVGLATLELLTSTARARPLLCLVDDAHWLDPDSTTVLTFLARRIAADPVAVLFATRPPATDLDRLPGLPVAGLGDDAARALLGAFPLDERVRERLVAEARGNPLALLELPRAGGFAPPGPASASTRVELGFRRRLDALPAPARLLLTTASADPTGDPDLLWPAARLLGVDVRQAGADAAATELAEFGARIRFCHPLARSAAYRAASPDERRRAHGALAEVTDPLLAPDRRAWHRAQATTSPDAEVATDLERCASRAQARGGVAAAAAFLERSAALSPDAGPRLARTLAAVRAHLDAGDGDAASTLLGTVDPAPLDESRRASVELLRGRVAFTRPDDGSGPALMVGAAERLSSVDAERARDCLVEAIETSLLVGRGGGVVDEVVNRAARTAPPSARPDVLDALITLSRGGYRVAAPALEAALHGNGSPLWTRWPAISVMVAAELWDLDALAAIAEHLVTTGRDLGSPVALRLGLAQRATCATLVGDVAVAFAATAEEEAVADALGEPPLAHPRLHLAALRGRRADALELAESANRGPGGGRVTNLHWTTALLANGLGDHPAALAAAREATAPSRLFLVGAVLPELVEAAVRCGEDAVAAEALEALTERAEASPTPSGLGVAACARGLVTGEEEHYRDAVDLLARSPLVPYRARAHLLYGEWLRRKGRRRDAVAHLGSAHELLSASGAEGFARRAENELRAAGERVDRRAGADREKLTAQEVAVAGLVVGGATSQEVAVQLFVSKRTVDAHLRNIFRKLGITSRRQLKDHPDLVALDRLP
ncbi:ATP-binding protein [Actinosynnema mirum]|uniref:Transcriptional regulator, LuxR family n=1 Tax=Actinosynnema mirum (strain ATCC 29888 / DSM 43827 / JCM 3225 / NBRC 14064 / NCIMB 13271 / NRRL B-12336 / IMRU 3971 / 101) TaxID=446462 RepID=C6WIN9_ACTMD|nr:LuxR family transcriptional regulator [Actinosynnema mirum]ACU38129.1 transcriptional regulator, LuxR family [Actinosynnema mirum DSM 43827]